MYLYKGIFSSKAAALQIAILTGKIALAPNFFLTQPYSFFVPSSYSTIFLSNKN